MGSPRCSFCHGTGRCFKCDGKGTRVVRSRVLRLRRTIACGACKGTGKCGLCGGTGAQPTSKR